MVAGDTGVACIPTKSVTVNEAAVSATAWGGQGSSLRRIHSSASGASTRMPMKSPSA
ncbi:hypothetical protein D3C75_1264460 [compost metagenome]